MKKYFVLLLAALLTALPLEALSQSAVSINNLPNGNTVQTGDNIPASRGNTTYRVNIGSAGTLPASSFAQSISLFTPSLFSSPINFGNSSGAFTGTLNYLPQSANTFLAAPSGSSGLPTMRSIVAADVPTLNQNTTGQAGTVFTINSLIGAGSNVTITGSGTVSDPYLIAASGGGGGSVIVTGSPIIGNLTQFSGPSSITNVNLSGDCITAGSAATVCTKTSGTPFAASATIDTTTANNISSGTLPNARIPNPSSVALGGIQSIAAVTHNFLTAISTAGVPSQAQPAASDITGLASSATVDTTNAANITSGTLPAARLPNPAASALGGVQSIAVVSNNFLTGIGTNGVPSQAQPAFTNLSGNIAVAQMNSGTGSSATTFWNGSGIWAAPFALTTTGTSGAATFSGGTLNIPNYATGGGGGDTITSPNGTISVGGTSSNTTLDLPSLSANQLLGSLTATFPTGLSVPSCSAATKALEWTSGTGFACNSSITAAAVTGETFPGSGIIVGTTDTQTLTNKSIAASEINSGTIALANGGTAANLGATGGTSQVLQQTTSGGAITVGQLAASNLSNGTTGSGAVVLATSPSLVTPALGTPASGVATNLTGTASGLTAGTVSTINSLITAGSNVTITGSGTSGSPYSIAAAGSSGITRSVSAQSANFSAGSTANTDYVYFVSNGITVTLASATSNTDDYTFINTDGSAITLTGTVNGTANPKISILNQSMEIISNGTSYNIK